MRRFIFLAILTFPFLVLLGQNNEVVKLTGNFSVNDAGSASYAIPISLPPGIGGMKPDLSLIYGSNGTNGLLGIGWGFSGFSVITRGSKTIAQDGLTKGIDFTYDDAYYLDGERLVLWNESTDYGRDGAQYGTETNSFMKIVSIGQSGYGPAHFEVYTKTGLKLTFGKTNNNKVFIEGSQTVLYYLLEKIEEFRSDGSKSNYMVYEYEKDETNASYRPKKIRYTLNDNIAPGLNNAITEVVFNYGDRTDSNVGYIYGQKISITKKLENLQIFFNNSIKENYSFEYKTTNNNQLLLTSVYHCIAESGRCSDRLTFDWDFNDSNLGFTEKNAPIPAAEIIGDGKQIYNQDLNNDGLTDIIITNEQSSTSVKIFLNRGDANFTSITHNIQNMPKDSKLNFIDANSDGFVDLVSLANDGSNIWYINNKKISTSGAIFDLAPQQISSALLDNTTKLSKQFYFIDYDGDARQDFLVLDVIEGHRDLYKNNSDSTQNVLFSKVEGISLGISTNDIKDYFIEFVDLDNDGKIDALLHRRNGKETNGHNKWYRNVFGLGASLIFSLAGENLIPPGYFKTEAISSSGFNINSNHTDGNGFRYYKQSENICQYTGRPVYADVGFPKFNDINGDGLIDIIINQYHSHTWFNSGNAGGHYQFKTIHSFINKGNWNFELQSDDTSEDAAATLNLGAEGFRLQVFNNDNHNISCAPINCSNSLCFQGFYYDEIRNSGVVSCGTSWNRATGDSRNIPNMYTSYYVDLNGDGKVDVLENFVTKNGNNRDLFINTNFSANELYCKSLQKTNIPTNSLNDHTKVSFGRFYKFGTDLFLYNTKDGSNKIFKNNSDGRPPVITSFKGQLGGDINIAYTSLNDSDTYSKGTKRSYPDIDFASSALVVKNYQVTEVDLTYDTWTETKIVQDISYKYFDGVINLTGRGFRGYKKLEISDNLKGFRTVKEFEEDSRLIAANLKSQKTYASNGAILSEEIYKNVQWRTKSDGTGQMDTFFVLYNTSFQDKIFTPYPAEIISKTFDLDGKVLVINNSRQYMDAFGNMIYQVFDYGDGCIDSIYHEYVNDFEEWFIGRLVKSTVFKTCPGQNMVVRESAFEYHPVTGLLTKEILEPNQGEQIRTEKSYEHDMFGNITKTTEKAWDGSQVVSRTKVVKYDALGRFQIEATNQAGHKVSIKVDSYRGLPIESTDENGLITKMKYNSFGILRETEYPDGIKSFVNSELPIKLGGESVGMRIKSEGTSYPKSSMLMGHSGTTYNSEITLFDGRTVRSDNFYNDQYRLASKANEIEDKYFEYDIVGRLTSFTEAEHFVWQVPVSYTTTMEYDGLSDKVINPLGQQMTKVKDVRQRLLKSIDNGGNNIVYKYDVQGQLSAIIAGDNEYTISYEYDIRGRMTAMIDPVLGREEYTYDGFNNLLRKKDGAGNVISYTYDVLNRVKTIAQTEGTIIYTYDQGNKAIGKISKITYPNYESNTTYDNFGRIAQNSISINGKIHVYKYIYNNIGKLDRLEHPSGLVVKYHYNNQFYLYKITNFNNGKLIWELNETDGKNRPTKTTSGNGITTDISYDFRDNIKQIKSSKGTETFTDLYLEYNEISMKTFKQDLKNNITESYEYDALNRLTKVSTSGNVNTVLAMTYDKWGNIASKSDLGTYHYNKDIPTLLEKIDFINKDCNLPSSKFDYEYTSFNKIKKITGDSTRIEIEYGPDNQRLNQRLYIHNQLIETRTYVSGDYEIITTNNIDTKRFSIGGAAGFTVVYEVVGIQSGKYQYLHKDDQGSIIAITNEQAKIEHTFFYDVWGNRIVDQSNDTAIAASYRGYTGHEHIVMLELINMNGRIYDPIMARFISPDPYIQDQTNFQNINRFSYVYNNPINYTDPSGYSVWDDIGNWGEELWDEAAQTVGWISSGISNMANGHIRDGLKNFGQALIDVQIKWLGAGKIIDQEGRKQFGDETWNQIVVASATIVVGIATGGTGAAGTVSLGTAIMSGMAAGATGGALSAYLAGAGTNDILKSGFRGGVVGGVSAGLTHGVGTGMESYYGKKGMQTFAGEGLRAIGHGAVQGTMNELQGGKFSQGFFTGMVSSIGSHAGSLYGTNPAMRVFSASIVGGSISSMTGGKFATGAVTGAFVEMYNQNAHKVEIEGSVEGGVRVGKWQIGCSSSLTGGGDGSCGIGPISVSFGGDLIISPSPSTSIFVNLNDASYGFIYTTLTPGVSISGGVRFQGEKGFYDAGNYYKTRH